MNAPTPTSLPPARRQRGFSLPEMLVASAVFMFVMIAAYQAFQRSQESYRAGQNQAEMVQSARVAFEQMSNDVRLAGFEFDLDGEKEGYPNQPDEPIEFMHRRAIVVRANFDFDKEMKGREPGLEFGEGNIVACCPIVTTANDEIIGFALGKPSGTLPTGNIVFKADTSGTNDTPASGDAYDTSRRDAIVESDGDIVGEETITIGNVELLGPGDAGYAPPYTLYRFQLNGDGSVSRQPYIDNVYSLEFIYYDDSGNVIVGPSVPGTQAIWGNDNGKDKEAGRATRWNVRRVAVKVETITPDTDLRLKARGTNTGVRNFQGRRMFTLNADIFPPNLGRRGARDRDINPPEPPRNVEVCTGQCEWVRVSWDPGPPEDRVADHVITLCSGGPCTENLSNLVAAFIQTANFDVEEMQEYVVFTSENSPAIDNGLNLWAKVVARNAAGTESNCDPDEIADCPTCCNSATGAIVGERCRPDSFESAVGGGYDPAHASFPDASPTNAGGMPIVTVETSPYFPPSLESRVALETPRWALNRAASAGTAPDDWTTKDLGGGVAAAITCHRQESTPADANSDLRTPFEAFWKSRPNTYVWRASANDPSSWGGAGNVRSFLPTAGNLIDFVQLDLLGGSSAYVESSDYIFRSTGFGDYYDGYGKHFVQPDGYPRPAKAVTPCEVYYYRFRAASLCWDDRYDEPQPGVLIPPDGEGDLPGGVTLKAWDTDTVSGYRARSKSISPFYPPLLNHADSTGNRDRPDQGTHDSDSYGGTPSSLDTYATPSYNLPQRVVDAVTGAITAWVKPEAPTEFYLTRVDTNADPMQAYGDAALFDARLIFNAARRTAPGSGQGAAVPAAFRTYRLYRKAASGAVPADSEFDFDTANPPLFAEFDTNAPNDVRYYTMQGELVPGPDGTFAELRDLASDWASSSPDLDCSQDPDDRPAGTTCVPYIYWLKTAQCTKFDDGIDTSSAETSAPSRPFLFPCDLTYSVTQITVSPVTATTAPNQIDYTPSIDGTTGPDCSMIQGARLLAYRQSGEYIGSSAWRSYDGGSDCATPATFNAAAVNRATRGLTSIQGDGFRFVVELSTSDDDVTGAAETHTPHGCRIRSDFGPVDEAVHGIPISCNSANNCGTAGAPAILGTVDENAIEVVGGNTMRIHVPILVNCAGVSRVDLRGLEIKLEKSLASGDNDIPSLTSAALVGGVQPNRTLPSLATGDACDLVLATNDHDAGEDDAGEADIDGTDGTMLLRWRDSFCLKTPDPNDDPCACEFSYPVMVTSAPELVIELVFAGDLCDVRVTQLNFRVPLSDPTDSDTDGQIIEDLVCTQRPHRAADTTRTDEIDAAICPDTTPGTPPDGPSGSDPDLPAGCTLEGVGRGPAVNPEIACNACTETCVPCQCPLLDTDSVTVDIDQDENPALPLGPLGDDPENDFFTRSTLLDLQYTQQTVQPCDSPDCDFTISEIEIVYQCGPDRDCLGSEPLGKLGDIEPPEPGEKAAALLIHGNDVEVALPDPAISEAPDPTYRRYVWNGLAIPIDPGETFRLRMRFDDSINGADITTMKIRFAQPFAAECNADGSVGAGFGPLCSAPTTIVLPY
jgi:type II secretory pathway pseudopilin PulG